MFFISFYLFLPQIFEEYSTDQFTHFALSSSNSLYFSLKALKEYSTLLFCCYISFYISPYISFSLSPSLSLSSPFSPPPLLFYFSIPATVHSPFTFNRQAFKHYSSGCWGPAVEHNHNTQQDTPHTRNAPYHSPFLLFPHPPLVTLCFVINKAKFSFDFVFVVVIEIH